MVEVASRILDDFLRIEGVRAALLVGRDGFVVEKVGEVSDVDALGALSISLLGAAESIGKIRGGKGIDFLSVEFVDSFFLICNVTADIFLSVISGPSGIGRVRYETKRIRLKLQAAL